MKLAERTVLLTGASSGIGRALALALSARGARLAIVARRERLLEELASLIASRGGTRPLVLDADLAERGSAAAVAERAQSALGPIEILVNNAGGGVGGSQTSVGDRDEAREAFEVNLWSPLALTAALVPEMRLRREGRVVNVTSMGQVMPVWSMGHYVATKAAFALATESLRLELVGTGVGVLEVIPGPVDTAVQGESRLLPGAEKVFRAAPVGKANVLAKRIVTAIERDRSRLVYPRRLYPLLIVPGIYRTWIGLMARRLQAERDPEDPRVIRTGSQGDPEALRARAEWEAGDRMTP